MNKKNIDLTVGNPLNLLIAFTLPALASNLLNQVYSITDSIIVGRLVGQTALASVGVCMPIILTFSAVIIGLNVGIGILMSQAFGKKDMDRMRHILANSIYLGIILGTIVAALGFCFTDTILTAIGTPEGPFADASKYMKITFLVNYLPIFYFMFSNVFRGIGDSYTALYILIVSVVSNIFMDYFFVANLGLGVAGTAYATAIAQFLSVVFAIIMMYVKYPVLRLKKADFVLDVKLFKNITILAVPIALQAGFNNLGNVLVQSCINGFGEAVMAAYTVASRIGTFSLMPAETVASSLSVYSGQNFGAKKTDRIHEGVRATHIINAVVSIVLGLILLAFGAPLVRVFMENPSAEILDASKNYLLFAAVPGILYGIMNLYQQVLRGINHANQSLVGSVMQLLTKVGIAMYAAFVLKNLTIVWLAWPISYIIGTIYPFIDYQRVKKRDLMEN